MSHEYIKDMPVTGALSSTRICQHSLDEFATWIGTLMERGWEGRREQGAVFLRFAILAVDVDTSLCGVLSHLQHASLRWTGSARITSADTIYRGHSQTLHTALPALFAAHPPSSQAYFAAVLR